jgi:uncharacterized DUF497 family protein
VQIREFVWPQDRVDHISRHGVEPEEFEEACFGKAFVQRGKSLGPNPIYFILGETSAGRFLFCLVIQFPDGKGFPVTARDMTRKEKERYKRWKRH